MQRFIGCYMGCRLASDLLLDDTNNVVPVPWVCLWARNFSSDLDFAVMTVALLAEMLSILVFALEVMNDAPVNRCA